MIFFGRGSLQLACALVILLHTGSAVGFNSTSAAATARCVKRERQALLMSKQSCNCTKPEVLLQFESALRIDLQSPEVDFELFEREILDLSFTSVIKELPSYIRGWTPRTYPYKSLVDKHGVLSTWGSEERRKDCCSWTGVKCTDKTGHVIWLDLHDKSFSGTLNPSLFELQHLTVLNLSWNYITSSRIPKSISSLKQLKYLDLSFNSLSGSLPSLLGNLTILRSLDLRFNEFYNVENLGWLFHLSSLKHLDLSGIDLSKVNSWLQVVNKLPHLTNLELNLCNLLNVVQQPLPMINTSTSLAVLDLSSNNLIAPLFQWLFNFSNILVHLDLFGNQLQGFIPESFGNMIFLEELYLGSNQFEGGIQISFGNLCKLRLLDLSSNNLKAMLPEVFGNLSGCLDLTLETLNTLNGTAPNFIGLLSELQELYISENSLNGVITDAHFSKLSKLKGLAMSSNFLSFNSSLDWIPSFQLDDIFLSSCKLGPKFSKWLQTQKTFSSLDISSNGISDSIPKWFWELSSRVNYLNISCNHIYGILPYLSMKFSDYAGIDFSQNKLEGPLPLFPANITSLFLSNNGFSGNISSLCSTSSKTLELLDISFNQLSGELPDCLPSWPNLKILSLGHNHLFGKIASSTGSLNKLETFGLRNNSFSGEIPSSLGDCNHLQFVDLSHNNFSGPVADWIGGRLGYLTYLLLGSNNFYGDISLRLCQLTNIVVLDFFNNSLSGSIPWCIHNMTTLTRKENLDSDHSHLFRSIGRYFLSEDVYVDKANIVWKGEVYEFEKNLKNLRLIDLSSNKLNGEIPQQICSLFELVQLNLSRNQLTGRIPADIGQMRNLESLDLSQNQLSGQLPSSMSQLSFLNTLNLSNNNFYGRIPSSTQLQSFSAYAFDGNCALCGPPLTPRCPEDEKPLDSGGRYI
ncbi:hypothetical protein SLEP1_g48459 [Rubroshorea leprosula]|uniref:Leucine-rich repeat-containing N-terminal plant-type domain-containing protein n=2 Tax=Rubroshorea leprosula TaxID=152421 RepID=A0AAV5LUJ9_9ROSI|nr:hypothetical protein SLEP1_g48459 [Rubroshorea leprosula]